MTSCNPSHAEKRDRGLKIAITIKYLDSTGLCVINIISHDEIQASRFFFLLYSNEIYSEVDIRITW